MKYTTFIVWLLLLASTQAFIFAIVSPSNMVALVTSLQLYIIWLIIGLIVIMWDVYKSKKEVNKDGKVK